MAPNQAQKTLTIDQVTLTVIDNYLTTTCREMGVAMMRTAFSRVRHMRYFQQAWRVDRSGRVLPIADWDDQIHGRVDAGRIGL